MRILAAGIVLALAAAGAAHAAERLDDSASPRSRVPARITLSDEGRPLIASRNPTRALVQVGRVEYRLATARYAGRQARIYFVVPALIPGLRSPAGLRVDWRSNGTFAGGSARPGERACKGGKGGLHGETSISKKGSKPNCPSACNCSSRRSTSKFRSTASLIQAPGTTPLHTSWRSPGRLDQRSRRPELRSRPS